MRLIYLVDNCAHALQSVSSEIMELDVSTSAVSFAKIHVNVTTSLEYVKKDVNLDGMETIVQSVSRLTIKISFLKNPATEYEVTFLLLLQRSSNNFEFLKCDLQIAFLYKNVLVIVFYPLNICILLKTNSDLTSFCSFMDSSFSKMQIYIFFSHKKM